MAVLHQRYLSARREKIIQHHKKNSFERERIRREIKAKGETHQSVLKTMSTTAAIVVRIVGIDKHYADWDPLVVQIKK